MPIRAEADLRFLRKFFFISLACIAFALYCLLDGIVLAPKKRPQTQAYAELVAEYADETERSKQWQEVVKNNNWNYAIPEKTPEELESYIMWQYLMAGACFLVAFPMMFWFYKNKGSWVEGDENSIKGSWGQTVNFSDIETVDKKKWQKKGIAKIKYKDSGQAKTFVMDDFKYERTQMGEIMALLEAGIKPEQIVNDSTADSPKTDDSAPSNPPE